jgi:hypothetical protein
VVISKAFGTAPLKARLLTFQRSDVNHMIDSIANVKADAKIAHVMKQIAEEELGKSVMSEALDNFNGMDSEELKQELTEKFEFADKIMNAMESSGLKPEDMPGIYQQISQQNMMLVGPFVDNSTGAFLYRWYTGEVFPVRWGKPYDGLNNNIPYFKGPGGKIYSIPSMINIGVVLSGIGYILGMAFDTIRELKHEQDMMTVKVEQAQNELRDLWSKYNKALEDQVQFMQIYYKDRIEIETRICE